MRKLFSFFTFYFLISIFYSFSQDEIDIVDPYEMKVSRSRLADTFYFIQNTTATIQATQKQDTLRSYDVFLEERQTPFGTAYMCNGKEVTRKKYLEYKQFWNASGACKPCLLYTYDDRDQLKYVAYQYQDCLCGSYKEYYKNGSLKVEGQFKMIPADNIESINSRDVCNVREGIWTYYLENGITERTETYVNGKLKETISPIAGKESNNKSTTQNNQVSDKESTPKNGLIKRIKDKNKSSEE